MAPPPNLEAFRLINAIINIAIYLFGSALVSFILFSVLIPCVVYVFNPDYLLDYNRSMYRLMIKESQTAETLGWKGSESLLLTARAQVNTVIDPLSNQMSSTSTRRIKSDSAFDNAMAILDRFNHYVANDWLLLQSYLLTIIIIRAYCLLPILLVVIPIWIGFFAAGEYTARIKFDDSFQPSSNRTKAWFQVVRFLPIAAITLPVIFVALPVYPLFAALVSLECYAIYKMRTESMEFV